MGLFTGSSSFAFHSHAYLHKPMFVALVLLAIVTLASLAALLFLFLWITVSRSPSTTSKASLGRSAAVVVLGDVGRSPRMCLHAQSLAEDGWRVALVGYKGTPPPPPLRRSSVRLHYVVQPFVRLIDMLPRTGGLFALLAAPLKVFGQSGVLFWILATQVKPPPELIVVQTPPALPTLFVVRLVGMLLGSRLIIDWHNLGYSILSLRFSPNSPIVRLAYMLEKWTGRRAFAHVCVTRALKKHLEETWRVKGPVQVLYDRPPSHYRRATVMESHQLFARLMASLHPPIADWCPGGARVQTAPSWSPFTQGDAQFAEWRNDRPALVVSSTSWTADEDFGMLLRAASMYERRARELNRNGAHAAERGSPVMLESPLSDDQDRRLSLGWSSIESRRDKNRRASFSVDSLPKAKRLPKMLLIVTGKGDLREQYVREIERLEREESWRWVRIRTVWLPVEDYPTLLGSADVGVSLHSSSSGMDLPMKVVDMLGCGLSVCALGFPCVNELVQHGQNGLVFYSDKELAMQLESLLAQHPGPSWLAAQLQPMASLFPEDIPKSPPISASSSPVMGFSADASRSSSPPPPSSEYCRPTSPLPMFTLLQSPMQSTFDLPPPPSEIPKLRNWSGNWKRIVRPLIMVADLEDDRIRQQARFRSSQRRTPTKREMLPMQQGSKKFTPRSSEELEKLRDPGGEIRRRRLVYEGDNRLSPDNSPQKTLRHRANHQSEHCTAPDHPRLAALQDPIEIDTTGKDLGRIPGIQISAPTT